MSTNKLPILLKFLCLQISAQRPWLEHNGIAGVGFRSQEILLIATAVGVIGTAVMIAFQSAISGGGAVSAPAGEARSERAMRYPSLRMAGILKDERLRRL